MRPRWHKMMTNEEKSWNLLKVIGKKKSESSVYMFSSGSPKSSLLGNCERNLWNILVKKL